MPTGSAVITAKTGPAVQATAVPISSISEVKYDVARNVLYVTTTGGSQPIKEFDLQGVTTATITIASGNFAFVIS